MELMELHVLYILMLIFAGILGFFVGFGCGVESEYLRNKENSKNKENNKD